MDPSVQTPRAQLGGDGGSLEEKVEKAAPPQITQRHVQGDTPPMPQSPNRAAARRAPPTWELPPSLPHPPISATYRSPQQKMHGECMGLRIGARVSERRPLELLSAHMRVTSTVNSVLGLPVVVVPYIKDHFLDLHILRLEASPPSRLPDSRLG